jgi:acyl-CoA synthetase (AMP-forming)/AMP-acid ligase II
MTLGDIRQEDILSRLPAKISGVVEPWATLSPDRPALAEAAGVWSYRQLADAIAAAGQWLRARGVRPGDRVLVVAENCRALVALLLAAAELDAWSVTVNAKLSEREIDQIVDHSGARIVLYALSRAALTRLAGGAEAVKIEDVSLLGPIGVGPFNADAIPEAPGEGPVVAALVYTSGTTGQPKGVMLTHRGLLYIARVSGMIRSLSPADRFYGVLPISHIVGLSVVVLGTLLHGATLYLTPRFNPAEVIAALARDRLTVILGAPTMFAMVLEYARMKGLASIEQPALRIISSSGAPLDPALKAATEQFFGMPLHNGYGITECSPTIAQTRVEHPRSDCSVGPVLPGVEARLVDSNGDPASPGEVGELWVRGPTIMKGYYKAPAETERAIDAEGWFNTQDLARFQDGGLFIVGRTKDLIIRFGFNVYPAEVEGVLNAHPLVTQSAVIGKAADGVEEIVALVQPIPDASLSPEELADYAAQNLAPYKRPSEIFIVEALPATPTGKILKRALLPLAESLLGARGR